MTDVSAVRDAHEDEPRRVEYPPILSTEEVAEMTGLNRSWFDRARKGGFGPPFIRITSRIIRYDRDEVFAWCRAHTTRG